jgi:exonuclease III
MANDIENNFTVVSLNIQDLIPQKSRYDKGSYHKIDQLRQMCGQGATPEIICLTETKLSTKIDSSEVEIAGYNLLRKDRNRCGGGVAIYYRDTLEVTALDLEQTPCSALECVAIKVTSRLKTMIFACFYRPPSSKVEWISCFHECIDYFQSLNLPLCILGDFNVNLLTHSSFADDLEEVYCLRQIITEPTRLTSKTSSLIDHVYLSHDVSVNNCGSFNAHISDHLATYAHINGFSTSNKAKAACSRASYYRCLKGVSQGMLLRDLSLVPWHVISDLGGVDDALQTFETLLIEVWDVHAPRKHRQRRRKRTPWMTEDVFAQIRCRNKCYKYFQRDLSDVNWMRYKQARNYATKMIRNAKRTFLLATASSSRNFWKSISECTGQKTARRAALAAIVTGHM